jgi:pimeloyl-ACP methyl ester carboxylesterase
MSIASLRKVDLRTHLNEIKVPTMGMYGDKDIVVHPDQWMLLQDGIPNVRVEQFHDAGHFIMLDKPQLFMHKLHDFLNGDSVEQ